LSGFFYAFHFYFSVFLLFLDSTPCA
jgi:hypothetical protein